MKRGFGHVGSHCTQKCRVCGAYHYCEHNQIDASVSPRFLCTGIGFDGECKSGEKFSCGENKDVRVK